MREVRPTIIPHVDDGDRWVACRSGVLRKEDLGEGRRCDALKGADCGHFRLGVGSADSEAKWWLVRRRRVCCWSVFF